jgi:hypothetical protein
METKPIASNTPAVTAESKEQQEEEFLASLDEYVSTVKIIRVSTMLN